jgi:hypothetical protein
VNSLWPQRLPKNDCSLPKGAFRALLLNNSLWKAHLNRMKHYIFSVALAALLTAGSAAQAACYADYKAKKDNPLQLHYGVIQLPDAVCAGSRNAASVIAPRLAKQGWTLLNVVSVFDDGGLAGRETRAGQYFLRF